VRRRDQQVRHPGHTPRRQQLSGERAAAESAARRRPQWQQRQRESVQRVK